MNRNSEQPSQSTQEGGSLNPWMAYGGGMWPHTAFPFNAMTQFMPATQTTPKPGNRTSLTKGSKQKLSEDYEDDVEEDDVLEDDHDLKLKRKYTPRASRGKPAQRGRGKATPPPPMQEPAMSAGAKLMLRRVKALPGQFHLRGEITFNEKEECPGCRMYKGTVILKPCGHAAFCYGCMDKFQKKCVTNSRLFMCPVSDCTELITGWYRMYNVVA